MSGLDALAMPLVSSVIDKAISASGNEDGTVNEDTGNRDPVKDDTINITATKGKSKLTIELSLLNGGTKDDNVNITANFGKAALTIKLQ